MSDINYKLKPGEIYITLIIKKYNSKNNYNYFNKYLNGFEYDEVFIPINSENTNIYPSKNKEGWDEVFNKLNEYSLNRGVPVVKKDNNCTV